MPGVKRTTKATVLKRFRQLLEGADSRFAHRTFIRADSTEAPDNQRDREFLTVEITGGDFDWAAQAASGQMVVPYQGAARVVIWQVNRRDRSGNDDSLLLSEPSGLFFLEQKILARMTGSYLEVEDGIEGDCILTQAIHPLSDSSAVREENEAFGGSDRSSHCRGIMSIVFGVDFHWDLGQYP